MPYTLRLYLLLFVFTLSVTACVPTAKVETPEAPETPETMRLYNSIPVVEALPIKYSPLDLPYSVRQSEQPTGLPDLVMLNNSVAINSISTVPVEESVDVLGLLVDAGIFGGKFLLRLTAYLDSESATDSFAFHQYDSLILDVDGQKILLSRDTNDIGISQQSDGSFVEYGFYTAFPNLYLILARANSVTLELIGGKDGIDRKLVASFTPENIQRFAEFYATFDANY